MLLMLLMLLLLMLMFLLLPNCCAVLVLRPTQSTMSFSNFDVCCCVVVLFAIAVAYLLREQIVSLDSVEGDT